MKPKYKKFDLFTEINNKIKKESMSVNNGDVIVISSKYISNSQGRILHLRNIQVSKNGRKLSKKFKIEPRIAEIIIRESDFIFGGINGYVIASSENVLAPNAGIDKSNTKDGNIVIYPYKPFLIAEQLKRKFFLEFMVHVGIIIIDSRITPARQGTIGIAVACSGIKPVLDRRSEIDLNGNSLKVTMQATADNLASIANHMMGEGSDSKPIAIIKNSGAELTDCLIKSSDMNISHEQCIYIRGLKQNKY